MPARLPSIATAMPSATLEDAKSTVRLELFTVAVVQPPPAHEAVWPIML